MRVTRRKSWTGVVAVGALSAVVVAGLLAGGVPSAGAERAVPAACTADPALNGNGAASFALLDDGSEAVALDVDAGEGNVVVLSRLAAGLQVEPVLSHQVHRYLTDGSLDPSFGDGGVVSIPGTTRLGGNESISADDNGRIWITRTRTTGTIEVLLLSRGGDLVIGAGDLVLGDVIDADVVGVDARIEAVDDLAVVALEVGTRLEVSVVSSEGEVLHAVQTSNIGALAIEIGDIDPQTGLIAGSILLNGNQRPFVFLYGQQPELFIDGSTSGGYTSATLMSESFTLEPGPSVVRVTGWSDTDLGRQLLVRDLTLDQWGNLKSSVDLDIDADQGSDAGVHAARDGAIVVQFEDDERVVSGLGWGRLDDANIGDILHSSIDPQSVFAVDDSNPEEPTLVGGFGIDRASVVLLQLTPSVLGDAPGSSSLADQTNRLYQAAYGRSADEAGLEFWTDARAKGMSAVAVATALLDAADFQPPVDQLSDAQFAERIWINIGGAATDAGSIGFLVDLQRSVGLTEADLSRPELLVWLADEATTVEATATVGAHTFEEGSAHRLYRAYFLRDADELGLCYWSRLLVGGESLGEVSEFFATSDEFDQLYGDLTDRQFVELVYQNVLGRAGEPEGIEFWSAELWSSRRTRGEVMTGFSESPEFILLTGTLPPN